MTRAMIKEQTGCTETELKSFEARGLVKATRRSGRGWYLYPEKIVDSVNELLGNNDQSKKMRRLSRLAELDANRPAPKMAAAIYHAKISYSSDEAITVITMVKAGRKMDEIFLETKMHPSIVRVIVKDYEMMSGSFLVSKEVLDQINSLELDGVFPITNEQGLLNVLALAATDHKCAECKKRPRGNMCMPCSKERVVQSMRKKRHMIPMEQKPTQTSEDTNEDESGVNVTDEDASDPAAITG